MSDSKCGVCCSCGDHGQEEATCEQRKDETHCNHWWDWCTDYRCPICGPKIQAMLDEHRE